MSNPFQDERFFPLREMESYTDEMFNRIISFQSREHAAWDETRPFDERIKKLALHDLVFSCPDRDPQKFGPSVAPYYPVREEIRAIAGCAKQVAKDAVIVDMHPGNGFIGSLIAREGVTVIGVRDPDAKPNQIPNFYDKDFYDMREMRISEIDFEFDVAFSAWMPSNKNLTPEIVKHKPKLIIFTYTDHQDDQGNRQTGTAEAYTDLPENYKLVAEWEIVRPENLFQDVWPELTPSPEEVRKVRLFADKPWQDIDVKALPKATPYDWENDLGMILLAMEAKAALRAQGVKVD